DNGSKSRTFATSSRASDQHDSILDVDDLFQLHRQIKIVEIRRVGGNYAHDDGITATLLEYIHAEPGFAGDTKRNVRRAALFQTLVCAYMVADNHFRHTSRMGGRKLFQPGKADRLQFAREFYLRRPAGRKNQIADFIGGFKHLP